MKAYWRRLRAGPSTGPYLVNVLSYLASPLSAMCYQTTTLRHQELSVRLIHTPRPVPLAFLYLSIFRVPSFDHEFDISWRFATTPSRGSAGTANAGPTRPGRFPEAPGGSCRALSPWPIHPSAFAPLAHDPPSTDFHCSNVIIEQKQTCFIECGRARTAMALVFPRSLRPPSFPSPRSFHSSRPSFLPSF